MSVLETPIFRGNPAQAKPSIPELQNGDRLSSAEFLRRYENMPLLKKAELIKGRVYMGSPVRHRQHGRPHAVAIGCFAYYAGRTPGVDIGDNSTLRLDEDNVPQPDLFLRIPNETGGKSILGKDGYLQGPVEIVLEVSASTVSLDAHDKFDVYADAGVREYVIWRVEDEAVDFFRLSDGRYQPVLPSADGLFKSEMFPGLWLDRKALLECDLPRLFAVLDAGVATAEHAAFVQRLAAANEPK